MNTDPSSDLIASVDADSSSINVPSRTVAEEYPVADSDFAATRTLAESVFHFFSTNKNSSSVDFITNILYEFRRGQKLPPNPYLTSTRIPDPNSRLKFAGRYLRSAIYNPTYRRVTPAHGSQNQATRRRS